MVWNSDNTISRDEAKSKISEMAREQGIKGAFKVFYNGDLMATPNDLPERVELEKVSVSAVLDQASNERNGKAILNHFKSILA